MSAADLTQVLATEHAQDSVQALVTDSTRARALVQALALVPVQVQALVQVPVQVQVQAWVPDSAPG